MASQSWWVALPSTHRPCVWFIFSKLTRGMLNAAQLSTLGELAAISFWGVSGAKFWCGGCPLFLSPTGVTGQECGSQRWQEWLQIFTDLIRHFRDVMYTPWLSWFHDYVVAKMSGTVVHFGSLDNKILSNASGRQPAELHDPNPILSTVSAASTGGSATALPLSKVVRQSCYFKYHFCLYEWL